MKRCNNCFETKPLTEFYVKRGFGYQSRCKKCNAEIGYVYKNKNRPDKIERYFERIDK
jgi:hypothetical protein